MAQLNAGRNKSSDKANDAFLNIPYDAAFADLYLAYIAGISAFGLTPRATLEIPGGERRLDRIFQLIQTCRYSFHDLSRVELDLHRPATPRFNMPFELGLAVAWEKLNPGSHVWFVLETKNRRVAKSLSDIGGTDVYVHDGVAKGVYRELGNALVRVERQPGVARMNEIYRSLKKGVPGLKRTLGAKSVFEAGMFKALCASARLLSLGASQ